MTWVYVSRFWMRDRLKETLEAYRVPRCGCQTLERPEDRPGNAALHLLYRPMFRVAGRVVVGTGTCQVATRALLRRLPWRETGFVLPLQPGLAQTMPCHRSGRFLGQSHNIG